MSLPIRVTPDVLIPRPETEVLVECILEDAKKEPVHTVLDMGTGSGCIAVSLAANLPEVRITALDVSGAALEIASKNAELNHVRDQIRFIEGDINTGLEFESKFDVVVSNPPYIARDSWEGLDTEIRDFEPREALCDESDGLTFYRLIAEQSQIFMQRGGRLYLETGDSQSGEVQNILKDAGFANIRSYPDLNRIDRVVRAIL